MVSSEKLGFVNQNTVGFWIHFFDKTKDIHLIINGHGFPLHTDATGNLAEAISGIQGAGHNHNRFALLFIVVGNLQYFDGFSRIHRAIFII